MLLSTSVLSIRICFASVGIVFFLDLSEYSLVEDNMARQIRRKFTPQEKVAILRQHLLEGKPVSDDCDSHGLKPSLFYRWQKEFFENGALFQWTAVERAIPLLLGPGAVATWEAESPFGRLTNYAVDDESATGRLEFLELERGLRVAIFDCIWQQEHTFLVRDNAWIRFNFSLSIDIEMFLNKDQAVSVNAPSWRIINNPPNITVREVVPGRRRAIWVTVCWNSAGG